MATALVGVVQAPSTASAASSKAPIVVGGVYQAADYPGLADGFSARVNQFNKAGGIDGRKIQFLGVQDDGSNPATNESIVHQLVQADHVIAVAPVVTYAISPAAGTFLKENKTPYIGWGVTPVWCGPSQSYAFSIDGCIVSTNGKVSTATPAMLNKVVAPKKPSEVRVAIVNHNDASASAAVTSEGQQFKAGGYNVVFNKGIIPDSGVTNYAPYVEQILAAKPDVVFISLDFASSIALSAALTQGGFTGVEYSPVDYSEGILLSQPSVKAAIQKQYVYTEMPAAEDHSPAGNHILAALKAIGKGSEPLGLGNTLGYYDADLLIQMLQNAKAKGQPLTGAGLAKAANSGFTYKQTAKGGACSETFPGAETTGVTGATLMQVEGGQYKLQEPYTCFKNVAAPKG